MKICKGINRAKGIAGCGIESDKRQFGLCPSCLYHWATTNENGKVWYEKQFLPRVEKKKAKNRRESAKEFRNQLTDWRAKLQSRLQEIARLIDIGLPCLALGYHAGQIHGGHVFSKGSNKTIALNLHNIHRQSAQSNHSHNDDGLLREKLSLEYGEGYFTFLSEMRACKALHYSNLEYMEFYKLANGVANMLKKEGRNYDVAGRIELRNNINLTLGIYEERFSVYK